jgi:hypothetical protein
MEKIALDEPTLAALTASNGLVAVTDATGKILGFFAPVTMKHAEEYADLAARASVAYSEGRRPKTTAELARDLEALGKTQ